MAAVDSDELREALKKCSPELWAQLSALAERWMAPSVKRLNSRYGAGSYPKTFNDPVWGVIELYPWETVILDSPLVQRLRGVRQLGMAHMVYPGAGHDRLEHARGVVEAADRMIRALERNADYRRKFGRDQDNNVPVPSDLDRVSTRLAALLHDVGHGPFSHATEPSLHERLRGDFDAAVGALRDRFEGVTRVSAGEIIAIFLVMSEGMRKVLAHERFGAGVTPAELPAAIAARILGSRSCLNAGYLSGIISGPIDADKLDYMSRDCHHAGLPLGQDVTRLISKLEVVVVTPETAPNPELRKRAESSPNKRFYEIGISQSGLGAYEQMIIGRVILYDRLYYHHKVRAAEAMVRTLLEVAEEERGGAYRLQELFSEYSDDAMVALIGGTFQSVAVPSGKERSQALAGLILERQVYYRGYAFAARFIGGLGGLPDTEQADTRALAWRKVLKTLDDPKMSRDLAKTIYEKARGLAEQVEDLRRFGDGLLPEHVLVDLPMNKVVVRGGDILTRTDNGHIGMPNLFFDPEKWSQAYEHQKQCGFVFTPRAHVPLVALASRIVFYERFGVLMGEEADRAAKTTGEVKPAWIEAARDRGCCGGDVAEVLLTKKPQLVLFHAEDFILPDAWRIEDAAMGQRLADEINDVLPTGLPASFHQGVVMALSHLCAFVDMMEKGGGLDKVTDLSEAELQGHLRNHLRSREVAVLEGAEVGGGETDLVLPEPGPVVIENKVRGSTKKPLDVGAHYKWQERRYSIAVSSRVGIVVLAYRPSDEAAVLPLPARIAVDRTPGSPEPRAQIRVVVPWGRPSPSDASAPST